MEATRSACRRTTRGVGVAGLALLMAGCTGSSPGFPAPTRPGVLVATDAETTFALLAQLLDARGMPVLVADPAFGNLMTDWIEWRPGEVDLGAMADCDLRDGAPVGRARARFGFEVRPRANRAQVTILTHFQVERVPGFDDSDRGYVDCRSTGEWERSVADALGARGAVVR